jgi:hypothetical protein
VVHANWISRFLGHFADSGPINVPGGSHAGTAKAILEATLEAGVLNSAFTCFTNTVLAFPFALKLNIQSRCEKNWKLFLANAHQPR